MRPLLLAAAVAALLPIAAARAQSPAARTVAPPGPAAAGAAVSADSLRLAPLLAAVERTDPRAAQRALLDEQSELRLRSIGAERLPALSTLASAQYVSDVPQVGLGAPGAPVVPHQQYDVYLSARQRLWDPSRAPRRATEEALREESRARLRATLWRERQGVADAFFALLALDAQRATLDAAIADLEAQRRVAGERVAAGTGLPSETALLDAELLRRRQSRDALASDREAARAVLESLTGQPVAPDAPLALPDLAADVTAARAALDTARARPEYAQFAAGREALAGRERGLAAQDRPRLSAFGRTGYGRPGLNPLARDFDHYWVAGLQVEWAPWSWGTTARDREVQRLQARILDRDEAAFTEQLRRAAIRDLAAIDQLARTLAADDAIIALHERVLAESRLRFGEGVLTAAELVDRETDVLAARLARDTHRARLDEARARFLNTLGWEIR